MEKSWRVHFNAFDIGLQGFSLRSDTKGLYASKKENILKYN